MSSLFRKNLKTTAAAACWALLILLTVSAPLCAQVPNAAVGFDQLGFIQKATVDSPGALLSGGTIKLNDITITVPANSIVQMPAATLSWGQVFIKNPLGDNTRTGMAMEDCGSTSGCLAGTYEAHVQGNIVNGVYIAGLIFLSQQSLNSTQGFVSSINYAAGELVVAGKRVQINDPAIDIKQPDGTIAHTGRHTVGQSPDERFSVDQDNPTIRSETGYPMCIPRVVPSATADDPRCPQRNRPRVGGTSTGALIYTFTMDAPRANPTLPPDLTKTDAWEQMPFEVGDFVTYWGVVQGDGSISAYQVIGNVGAYTFPGTNPVYIGIDVLLQGTGGVPNPAFPQEVTSKVKVEGFSTDDSRPVDILALDQDCNGNFADRTSAPWALAFTVDPGPPTGAKRGRFRFRPLGGAFLPPVSQARVRVSGYTGYLGASPNTSANGLIYGQYHAPDFAFVFPENLGVGDPPLTNNFQDFAWLVNGIGPWSDGSLTGTVGQLSPWPDNTAPTASCTAGAPPPTLNANFTATPNPVLVNNPITLDASAASLSGATSFTWSPLISCSNFSCSNGTFTPTTTGTINFKLTVTNAANATVTSPNVAVTVNKPSTTTDTVVLTNVVYRTSKGRLDVTATSSIVMASPTTCTVSPTLSLQPGCMAATLDIINPSTGKPYVALMQNLGNGTYTVTFTGLAPPNLVTVTSGNGGSATGGVTRVR